MVVPTHEFRIGEASTDVTERQHVPAFSGWLLPGSSESVKLKLRLRETHMAADSNSKIAWHRAQIRKHCEALKHLETAKFTFGEIAGSKTNDQTQKTVAELKRKIRESEQIIAAYERQTRRPLTTDYQTLASVPWSNWNARGSSDPG